MDNGNYEITNPKTGSVLWVQLTDSADVSAVQKDKNGNTTGQVCYSRSQAVAGIEKAKASGVKVKYSPLKDILGNTIK